MYSAYLDRFTDNDQALLLIESLGQQFHVPITRLPEGSIAGTWLLVDIQDEEITLLEIDKTKSAVMKTEVESTMQRLQSKKKSRFKRQ